MPEEGLDLEATCVEWLQRNGHDIGEPEARKFIGKFGLSGKLALQKIGTLSGGCVTLSVYTRTHCD